MRTELAMNRVATWVTGGVLAILVAGCESKTSDKPKQANLELISWWGSDDEVKALDALLAVHKRTYPLAEVENSARNEATKARETIRSRWAAGVPPNTFQANIGSDLLQWANPESRLEPLESLIDMSAFRPFADATAGGSFYGVPVNVHRINSLFYDKAFFDAYASQGLHVPTTIEEFRTVCPMIKRLGRTCLAVGDKWAWVLSQITFEMILPGIAGAEYYRSFWLGRARAADENVTKALELMLYLRCGPQPSSACDGGYINSDVNDIDWPEAIERVMAPSGNQPQAAMAATGDWAKGAFLKGCWRPDAGLPCWEPNVHFGVEPFPTSQAFPNMVFVYTSDTFPLPRGVTHRAETVDLLRTFASVEGQVAFNQVKGSIPARTDIRQLDYPRQLDTMHAQTMADFASALDNGTLVLARSGLQKPNTLLGIGEDGLNRLDAIVQDSLAHGNILRIRQYLQANYQTLAQ
jgi:glucose/mannose transport system substrate-binding protein